MLTKYDSNIIRNQSGYQDKSLASAEVGEEATWAFSGGAAAIDSVTSSYVPGGQRRFKFFTSTYEGAKTCKSEWTPSR